MEKPRRRRSIRNLRASIHLQSPPMQQASYGSAWIDHDLDTNMDNLVLSLSQLPDADNSNSSINCSNDAGHAAVVASENPGLPETSTGIISFSEEIDSEPFVQSPYSPSKASPGIKSHFEGAGDDTLPDNCLQNYSSRVEVEDVDQSICRQEEETSFGSFSFSPDMPLQRIRSCESHNHSHFSAPATPGVTLTSSAHLAQFDEGSPCANSEWEESLKSDSETNSTPMETWNVDLDSVSGIERDLVSRCGIDRRECNSEHVFGKSDLQHAYNDLSLNFSPVPEQDQTISLIVGSVDHDCDLSFSPQGTRPETPKLRLDAPCTDPEKSASLSENFDEISPVRSENSSWIHNATYTLPGDGSNETSNLLLNAHFSNMTLDSTSSITNGSERNDNGNRQNKQYAALEIEHLEESQISGTVTMDVHSHDAIREFDSLIDSNARHANGIAYFESKRLGETGIDVQSFCHVASTVTDMSNISTRAEYFNGLDMTRSGKKRQSRRSSRFFNIQETTSVLDSKDEEPVDYLPTAPNSDAMCRTDLVLELEKENFEPTDVDSLRSLDLIDHNDIEPACFEKTVMSESTNTKNVPRKKRGRKSGSFRKGRKSVGKMSSSSDASVTLSHLDVDSHGSDSDKPVVHSMPEEKERKSQLCPGEADRDINTTNTSESLPTSASSTEIDDNPLPARSLRARRNRKSWGNVMSRPCPDSLPVQILSDEASRVTSLDLEEIYRQKYSPVKPCGLEVIKELPVRGMVFGKQKGRRLINFSEDYRPTAARQKQRVKKMLKHSKSLSGLTPMDDEEFQSRLKSIWLDLDAGND